MKKFTQITKLFSGLALSLLAGAMMILAPMKVSALSIPYNGANTPPAPYPAFNVFTGTPFSGDEHDFLRGKLATDVDGDSKNIVDTACQDGTTFTLRVYVHNGASQDLNGTGDGPSVAKGVSVKVGGVTSTSAHFTPNATITALGDANGGHKAETVTDDMHINCTNGAVMTMKYLPGTAKQYSIPGGSQPLSDTIVTTGAPIGTMSPNGSVWGCWDQRVYVTLNVQVNKPAVIPTGAECRAVEMVVSDNRRVHIAISAFSENVQVLGYQIIWDDGSVSDKQVDDHQYTKDGTFHIVGRVHVKFPDGHDEWKTAVACAKDVAFTPGKPPVVPPTTPPTTPPAKLADTGPGSVAAIFAATSAVGAVAYRVFISRRLSRQ